MTIASLIVDVNANTVNIMKGVEQTNKGLDQINSMASKVGGALATAFSTDKIIGFGKTMIDAFSESEDSMNRLVTALQAQGQATPAVIQQYNDLATQIQNTTTTSDDAAISMMSLFTQVGHVGPQQMGAALQAALNLSAGLGMDLQSATMLVAKAFGKGGDDLGRLKGLLGDAVPKGADMAQVLDVINSKFGGQAQAALNTYSGQVKKLENDFNNTEETLGHVIVNALNPLMHAFSAMPAGVQAASLAVAALTPVLAMMATAAGGLALAFGTTIPAAFAIALPFLGPVGLIAAGVGAVFAAWKYWDQIVDFFAGAWQFVVRQLDKIPTGLLVPLLGPIGAVVLAFRKWDEIVGFVKGVYEGVKTWLVDRFVLIIDSVQEKVAAVTGFFKDMYDKVVGHSYVPDMIAAIGVAFGTLPSVMVTPTETATGETAAAFAGLQGAAAWAVSGIGTEMGKLPDMMTKPADDATAKTAGFFNRLAGAVSTTMGGISANISHEIDAAAKTLNGIIGISDKLAKIGGAAAAIGTQLGGGNVVNGVLSGASEGAAIGSVVPGIGTAIGAGIGAIIGGIGSLFGGGPSQAELQGRQVVAAVESQIAASLTKNEKMEAQGESWKKTVIGVRDAYRTQGISDDIAMRDVQALWESSKGGPDQARRIAEMIEAKMEGWWWKDPMQGIATGGMITPTGVARFASDTVGPFMLSPGEMVLNPSQQRSVFARGGGGGFSMGDLHIHAKGNFADTPQGRRELADMTAKSIEQQMRLRGRVRAA